MTKITLAVSKVYKTTGRLRRHRKNTKPAWKHYFLEENEPDEYTFGTEWVDAITAQFLKLRKWHKRYFICEECATVFSAYIKNDRMEAICPYCEEDD